MAERVAGLVVGMRLDISILKEFEDFADQFDWSIADAMNKTAKGPAIEHMRDGLSSPHGAGFTVRNTWTPGGIAFFKSASKRDKTVKIGAINDYLRAQTVGTNDPTRPEGEQAIGAIPIGSTRQPETSKTSRRNDWPRQLIGRGLAFRFGVDHRRKTIVSERASAKTGRVRKVRTKEAADPLKPGDVLFSTRKHQSEFGNPLWLIVNDKDVRLDPAYPAARLTREAFDGNFADHLYRSIKRAIRRRKLDARGAS